MRKFSAAAIMQVRLHADDAGKGLTVRVTLIKFSMEAERCFRSLPLYGGADIQNGAEKKSAKNFKFDSNCLAGGCSLYYQKPSGAWL